MIHSKVVVVDPFGPKPVVITGSHNLGPKASAENDDNMVIIENAPGLAAEYAVNIMNVYGHYKWLYNAYMKAKGGDQSSDIKVKKAVKVSPQYDGNMDGDQWQQWYTSGPNRLEIDFWLGAAPTQTGGSGGAQAKTKNTTGAKKVAKSSATRKTGSRAGIKSKSSAGNAGKKRARKKAPARKAVKKQTAQKSSKQGSRTKRGRK